MTKAVLEKIDQILRMGRQPKLSEDELSALVQRAMDTPEVLTPDDVRELAKGFLTLRNHRAIVDRSEVRLQDDVR